MAEEAQVEQFGLHPQRQRAHKFPLSPVPDPPNAVPGKQWYACDRCGCTFSEASPTITPDAAPCEPAPSQGERDGLAERLEAQADALDRRADKWPLSPNFGANAMRADAADLREAASALRTSAEGGAEGTDERIVTLLNEPQAQHASVVIDPISFLVVLDRIVSDVTSRDVIRLLRAEGIPLLDVIAAQERAEGA